MRNQSFSAAELPSAALPYDRQTRELDDSPRWIAGNDVFASIGGKTVLRPGLSAVVTNALNPASGQINLVGRIDRLWIQQTLETPPRIFVLASVNTGPGVWQMFYIRPSTDNAWTNMGSLRNLNASTQPHEGVVHQGIAYIRSVPTAGGNKLGSVIFDPTQSTPLQPWGALAPAVPVVVTSQSSWETTLVGNGVDYTLTVNVGWQYVYAYHFTSGHVSSRSPYPGNTFSGNTQNTGPFSVNKLPQFTGQFSSDPTCDQIWIFRTTDGGGLFGKRDFMNNVVGNGTFTYNDLSFPNTDPLLDLSTIAPGSTSNFPPPGVIPPKISGTDAVQRSSPIASHVGRIWFAIGQRTFYSAYEEVQVGLPTHSFNIGFGGNWIDWPNQVLAHLPWNNGLLVFTTHDVFFVQGYNLETFSWGPLIPSLGGRQSNRQAFLVYEGTAFWLTRDYRIAQLDTQRGLNILSYPLKDDIKTWLAGASTREIVLQGFSDDSHNWLIVAGVDTAGGGKWWVYDLTQNVWNPPWVVAGGKAMALARGQLFESDNVEKLVVANFDGTNSYLTALDFTVQTDYNGGAVNIPAPSITLSLGRVPLGNIIEVRRPGFVPVIIGLKLERTVFGGDSDPTVAYLTDEISGTYTAISQVDPPRRAQSTTIKELWYELYQAHDRASWQITGTAGQQFELQGLAVIWAPESGA